MNGDQQFIARSTLRTRTVKGKTRIALKVTQQVRYNSKLLVKSGSLLLSKSINQRINL